jgi:hypothetical protein
MKSLLTFLLLVVPAIPLYAPRGFAQSVSLGFKIGVRPTGEVSDSFLSRRFPDSPQIQQDSLATEESRRLAFAPTIQFHLPTRMSVEAGVLYRTVTFLSTTHTFETNPVPGNPLNFNVWLTRRIHAKSIEVPTLLRFWLSDESLRPFVGTGYVYRRFLDPYYELPGYPEFVRPLALTEHSNHGVPVTVGVELKTRFFRISPELRYTRWNRKILDPLATNLNQIDLFLGLSF